MCDCVWKTKAKLRHTDREREGPLCSIATGWRGKDPSWLHVSWTVTAVKRRHARLSVKLETTGAQLTTKSLIVRTSVHSHSQGKAERRLKGEMEVETHFTA